MIKNLKYILIGLAFIIIISFIIKKCTHQFVDSIEKEHINEQEIKTNETEDALEETTKIEETTIYIPKTVEYEGYNISDINPNDFEIQNFNDKEKQIYQSSALWKRKSDGKLFFRGIEYEEELNKYTTPLDFIGVSSDKYEEEMYLENKVWVDKIGVDNVYKGRFEREQVIYELCKKNCDFSKYMLTDNFKSKYNEKDGILGKVDYDSIEYTKEYKDGGAYDLEYTNVIITKGKVKTEYKIDYIATTNLSLALDDVDIFSIRDLTNEKGEEIKLKMDEHNWLNCIKRLAFQDDDEVGKSQRFIEEHPDFQGLIPNIIKYYPEYVNRYFVNIVMTESNFNDKKVVINFFNKRLGKIYRYEIIYSVDKNNYIDTYNIISKILVDVEKYNKSLSENIKTPINFDCKTRLIDNNRELTDLPLTKNFVDNNFKKFDEIHNIDIIDYHSLSKDNKSLILLYDFNKNKHFYGLTFKIVDNLIDDVEVKKLDITEFPEGDAAFDLF